MRTAFLFAYTLLAPLAAQGPMASDVGLQFSGTSPSVIYGQVCFAVTCTPVQAGMVLPGAIRTVTVHGAPTRPYVLAIGLPGVCFPFPGIGNMLMLNGPVTLAVGAMGNLSLTTCPVSPARYTLNVPPAAPTGWTFRLQALVMSFALNGPAFTPALDVQI